MVKKRPSLDVKAVELYVSGNCWVGKSLDGILDDKEEYHVLPATEYGLIAVISVVHPPMITEPIHGYLVYRPKLLQIVFPQFVKVHLVTLDLEDMQSWAKDSWPWVRVGERKTRTRGNTW